MRADGRDRKQVIYDFWWDHHMAPSQIDRIMCLAPGAAHDRIVEMWVDGDIDVARQRRLRKMMKEGRL